MYPTNSIKTTGESLGITKIRQEALSTLAQDTEYRVRSIIQDASKFMRHSKRKTLLVSDINNALKLRNIQPIYGHDYIANPKYSSVLTSTEDVYFEDEEEVDLSSLFNKPIPAPPQSVVYSTHWLAIEGVQPKIPQNPDFDLEETPAGSSEKSEEKPVDISPLSNAEILVKHTLSRELQLYFDCIKSSLLGSEVAIQNAAIECIESDAGIHQLIPYFIQLANDMIFSKSSTLHTLNLVISLIKAILTNPHFYIEPYLHQILPLLLTCLLGVNLTHNSNDNHWELRDKAAELIGFISASFGNMYHSLSQKLARTFLRTLLDPSMPLESTYGSIKGIFGIGKESVRVLLLPNIKLILKNLQSELSKGDPQSRPSVDKILSLLQDSLRDYAIKISDLEISLDQPAEEQDTSIESIHEQLKLRFDETLASKLVSFSDVKSWWHILLQ
ncbi:hypothetical protein BB560_001112 [Smittium megazygosporum]|uniref:TATA box binding protein associated factor (TAF) histone-like fold domain-containing protein n=1 Tax=Smittium megazygosporum TaxID=133381 RepID=A0A2T9ZIH6_9FUNG|nr:hypothetical protein BB560_001112 [Smittium megazygosporum]